MLHNSMTSLVYGRCDRLSGKGGGCNAGGSGGGGGEFLGGSKAGGGEAIQFNLWGYEMQGAGGGGHLIFFKTQK